MRVVLATSPHLDHSYYLAEDLRSASSSLARQAQTFVPMGLLSLAGAAKGLGDVQIADINKAINARTIRTEVAFHDDAAAWLLERQPDVVGFMAECDSYHHIISICRSLKRQNPSVITLLGGVCASTNHYETIRRFDDIDYIIRSEGEVAFPDFLTALGGSRSRESVGNLTFRDQSKIHASDELALIADLDSLPMPDLAMIDVGEEDALWVEIGRGCPFKCNFCVTAPYWKRRHRIKSPARIIAELDYFQRCYGRRDFNFTHDLFTTDRRWVIRFCEALCAANLNVTWTCSSRTDTIDDEQIHWLKQAGCRDIYFGVEAGTAAMQARIKKDLDLADADAVIEKVLNAGIGATIGFIVGLPGESEANLRGTLDKAHQYLSDSRTTVHLFGFGPYRGSPHFDQILPQLVFDPAFADFPQPPGAHDENCELMREHFDVFTRYSRLRSYDGVDVSVIRTAEEYLPIVNVLREIIGEVQAKGAEPFELLVRWTRWIEARNSDDNVPKSRRYYGTIGQYIQFLRVFCRESGFLDDAIDEGLRWEERKNELRTLRALKRLPSRPVTDANLYFTNPTVKIERFNHLGELSGRLAQAEGEFAFFADASGAPQIVRLNPLAAAILYSGQEGVTPDAFSTHVNDSMAGNQIPRDVIGAIFRQLDSLDLLMRSDRADAPL